MSRSTTNTITCLCGQVHTCQTYEYVNVAEDPQLRYVVLAGLLNVASCPMCGRRVDLAQPFIYSDPDHNLLAYIHPQADAPDEARELILEKLRTVYLEALQPKTGSQQESTQTPSDGGHVIEMTPSQARNMPPLKVLFGLEQLTDVINADLDSDERLGRLALNTHSRSQAERGQFLDITRKLATEMGCCIEVEDLPDEYTVWLYGSRRQIAALMRSLAPRG